MRAYRVELTGRGTLEIVAYGVADAEYQAEKELYRAWPEATLRIPRVEREPGEPRIAELFRLEYLVRAAVARQAEGADDARRGALRHARERLAGTRFERAAWDEPLVRGVS